MGNRYQSTLGLTESGEPGVFDTVEWFNTIADVVEFPGLSVLDVGCAEGVMSVMAAEKGARLVRGVDVDGDRVSVANRLAAERGVDDVASFVKGDVVGAIDILGRFDVMIASMIIHWIGRDLSPMRLADYARKWFVVVYREANDHYLVPDHGVYFPSQCVMDEHEMGRAMRVFTREVARQDNGKAIRLSIYRTDMIPRRGENGERMLTKLFDKTSEWTSAINAMYRCGAPLDVLVDASTPGGYTMHVVDGVDLHGRFTFNRQRVPVRVDLSGDLLADVRRDVLDLARAGVESGATLADPSRANTIVSRDGDPFFVDFDELAAVSRGGLVYGVISGDADVSDVVYRWQNYLDMVGAGIDFTRDPNLNRVIKALS